MNNEGDRGIKKNKSHPAKLVCVYKSTSVLRGASARRDG